MIHTKRLLLWLKYLVRLKWLPKKRPLKLLPLLHHLPRVLRLLQVLLLPPLPMPRKEQKLRRKTKRNRCRNRAGGKEANTKAAATEETAPKKSTKAA